jgi:hypothetical protein
MDMTAFNQLNLVAAGEVDQIALPISKLRCRWHKANDGALVMTWSLAEATRPALDLNSPRSDAVPTVPAIGFWKKAQLRSKAVAEHFAIALLLGGGALLAFASFMVDHNDLL